MKTPTLRCLLVYVLSLLVLCHFQTSEAAAVHQGKAHNHRTLRARHHTKGHEDTDNEQSDDNEESSEDDEDDDDEEEEETPTLKPVADTVKLSKAEGPHAAERSKMEAEIEEAEKDLAANVAEQKELKDKIKHLSDEPASNMEIDSQAKLVANETESPAMGTMLAKMWKEMRMFELPFFAQHVEEELHMLKREEKRLESELTDREAKLAAAEKKWAAEDKTKKAEEESEEKKQASALEKDDKEEKEDKNEDKEDAEEESKEDEDEDAAVGKGEQHKEVASGVSSVESGGEEYVDSARNGDQRKILTQYSYWHMGAKQKTNTLWASLIYLLFGILIAYLYDQVRKKRPEYLSPHPVQERARGSYQIQQKDFTNGIFGCFADIHVCVSGCFCTACRWSHTVSQKNLMSYWKAFFLMFLLMVIHPYTVGLSEAAIVIVGVIFRQRLRQKYGIERPTQTVVLDCFAWMCCMPCAVIQEAREEAVKRDFGNDP